MKSLRVVIDPLLASSGQNRQDTAMAMTLKPIRRVVTGNDTLGRSKVLFDGPAPNVNPGAVAASAAMTDLWVWDRCPAPHTGGHFRIVQSAGKPPGYDPATDKSAVPLHAPRQRPGGTRDKGGQNAFSSP